MNEQNKSITHVEIVASVFANQNKQDCGIWKDGSFYCFEPVGFTGRDYLRVVRFNREPANIEVSENNGVSQSEIITSKKRSKKTT